jgi:hypothetical protein
MTPTYGAVDGGVDDAEADALLPRGDDDDVAVGFGHLERGRRRRWVTTASAALLILVLAATATVAFYAGARATRVGIEGRRLSEVAIEGLGDGARETGASRRTTASLGFWNELEKEVTRWKDEASRLGDIVDDLRSEVSRWKNEASRLGDIVDDLRSEVDSWKDAVDRWVVKQRHEANRATYWAEEATERLNKYTDLVRSTDVDQVLDLVPGIRDTVEKWHREALKFEQMMRAHTMSALESIDAFSDDVMNVIDDAQSALENIANNLETEIRKLVEGAIAPFLGLDVENLAGAIHDAFMSSFNHVSGASTANLGSKQVHRDRQRALVEVRRDLAKVFRGETVESRVWTSAPTLFDDEARRASLGASGDSGDGSCADIGFQGMDDYDSQSYLMPWPEKFKDDAPNPMLIKFPHLNMRTCAKLTKLHIPKDVSTKLSSAFHRLVSNFVDETISSTGLLDFIDDVKDLGGGKFFSRRRLLSVDEKRDLRAMQLKYKDQLASKEDEVFERISQLYDLMLDPSTFNQHRAHTASTGDSEEVRDAAELGVNFSGLLDRFTSDLMAALDEMKDTEVSAEFSLGLAFTAAFKAEHSIFHEGEILKDFFNVTSNSVSKVMNVPIAGPLLALVADLDFSIDMPYFFRTDMKGEIELEVEIDFPISLTLSQTPSVTAGVPLVLARSPASGAVVSGLQVGLVTQLGKLFVGLCAGPVCAGPQGSARQDVYVGLDAFVALQEKDAMCHEEGANTLIAMWTDWDYSAAIKKECLFSYAGIGGYLQIPKTQVSAVIAIKPLPTDDPASLLNSAKSKVEDAGAALAEGLEHGSDAGLSADPAIIVYDFSDDISRIYDSEGDFHVQDLFHACSEKQSSDAKVCEESTSHLTCSLPSAVPAAAVSSIQTESIAADRVVVKKQLQLLDTWTDVGIRGDDYLRVGAYFVTLFVNNHAVGGKQWFETYSGIMSWSHFDTTNSHDADEIVLHAAGHARNDQYVRLRVLREVNGKLTLQAATTTSTYSKSRYSFTFTRMFSYPHPQAVLSTSTKSGMDEMIQKTRTFTLGDDWTDVGVGYADLSTGTYAVMLYATSNWMVGGGQTTETYSGIMSWYSGGTNNDESDEITLHAGGRGRRDKLIRLRTRRTWRTQNMGLRLEARIEGGTDGDAMYNFHFRRLFPRQLSPLPTDVTRGTGLNQVTTFVKTFELGLGWTETGIQFDDLATGTYALSLYVHNTHASIDQWMETYSGIVSWYAGSTNSPNADDVVLHSAGHANGGKRVLLRVRRTYRSEARGLQLDIAIDAIDPFGDRSSIGRGNGSGGGLGQPAPAPAHSYEFHFRRLA